MYLSIMEKHNMFDIFTAPLKLFMSLQQKNDKVLLGKEVNIPQEWRRAEACSNICSTGGVKSRMNNRSFFKQ